MTEQSGIHEIRGIGDATAKKLAKLNIHTVGELIRYYPRAYDIYEPVTEISSIDEEKKYSICGKVSSPVKIGGSAKMQIATTDIKDATGSLRVIWFRMPYLRSTLHMGDRVILRGKITRKKNGFLMEHPDLFLPPEKYTDRLLEMQPIYGLTSGITNNLIVKSMRYALSALHPDREDIPTDLRVRYGLCEKNYAIRKIHFPENTDVYLEARKRLVFDEFLEFLIALRSLKECNETTKNRFPMDIVPGTETFLKQLPFTLTKAQERVWKEIAQDLKGDTAMSRLVQGDVGSGKTIVAILALLNTALNGYQGALMAPTEVLARQHYETITGLFEQAGIVISVTLLTGSMKAKEKRQAKDRIECGLSKIVIGTHALIQNTVSFDNLALVITDEQHRFGVSQRQYLSEKGCFPHVLVMSATPIPRTLAMILYGDLHISVIDERPANRLPVKNCVVGSSYRPVAHKFMRDEIAKGHQVFVICPMVEESEALEAENVLDYAASLQKIMGEDIHVSHLHGRMKQEQKDAIMQEFADKKSQILVSTTVIEVGIDVPNATVMLIENAERFGLAQLHQIRGRVGRGEAQSYCIFMTSSDNPETMKRLEILNATNDGFRIASEDLRQRGPGDLFGIRQSGLLAFQIADIYQDAAVLQMASEAAEEITDRRPDLLRAISERLTEGGITL